MKKSFLPIAFLMLTQVINAQYFEHLYGTQTAERLSDGHNAYEGGNTGHFLIGPSEIFSYKFETFCFNATRTDLDGNVAPAPYFNQRYYFTEDAYPLPALNDQLHITTVKSYELTNSTDAGFTVAASYANASDGGYNLFHVRIDPDGNVDYGTNPPSNNAARYKLKFGVTSDYAAELEVVSIKESAKSPNEVFICGNMRYAHRDYSQVFIIKVDESTGAGTYGNIIWSKVYDLDQFNLSNSDYAADIIESPYQSQLLVVGKSVIGNDEDAFVLRVNDGNGNIAGTVDFHGTPSSIDGFTGIKASSNTHIDAAGQNFVICGSTNRDAQPGVGDQDFWLVSIDDATGTAVWSNTFDYSDNTGTLQGERNLCRDLIERYNTATAKYEYYLAGITYIDGLAELERMVVKTDEFGRGYQQFLYANFEADDLMRIDQLNGYGTHVDGISLFGSVAYKPQMSFFSWDHALIKAYFNGVTSCNLHEVHFTPWRTQAPLQYVTSPADYNEFEKVEALVGIFDPLNDLAICHASQVTGGAGLVENSNEKDRAITTPSSQNSGNALGEGPLNGFSVFPSQLPRGASNLSITVESAEDQNALLTLVDLNGKILASWPLQLIEGKNQQTLPLSDLPLSSGTYLLELNAGSFHESAKLLITN